MGASLIVIFIGVLIAIAMNTGDKATPEQDKANVWLWAVLVLIVLILSFIED